MAQSFGQFVVHVIFATKDRRQMIVEALQPELNAYIAGVLKNLDCPAISVGSAPDHMHVLFNLDRDRSVSEVVNKTKTNSSRWIKSKGLDMASFSWQKGYAVFSVSQSRMTQVKAYIAKQPEHHRKVSFREELIAFLKKHHIEHDERYLWE